MEIQVREPGAECQREVLRALVRVAEGGGVRQGTVIEYPLDGFLSEYQWDRCWWNARWWSRNEEPTAYELFRLAGKGCPIEVDASGRARLSLDTSYPARVGAALSRGDTSRPLTQGANTDSTFMTPREELSMQAIRDSLRVRAIRFEQNGRVFYTTVVPADEIIQRSRVDLWSADVPDEEAGYQRAPMATRLRDMANYIEEDDAILPVGGLLNARSESESAYGQVLGFEPDAAHNGTVQSGWLTIPSEATPLFIVDMQHRLLGIERAIYEDSRSELADFPVVVTIADGLSKLEEIEQFELINTTQKKVRTDLARRLMSMQLSDPDTALKFDQKGRKWEARGPKIADWLNRNSEIWRDAIMPPNKMKRQMPTALTKETSFVTSLKPILQTPVFQRTDDEQVATLIDRYWHAVRNIWPEPFKRPDEHVIHRTSGVFSLHQLMPEVFELARADAHAPTTDRMTEVIDRWHRLGDDFWAREREDGAARYGTSMGAFSRLAAELRKELPEMDLGL